MTQILWLRNDLRLDDHAGFRMAAERGTPLAVIYILPEHWTQTDELGMNRLGAAKAHYLRSALIDLHRQLEDQTIDLHIYSGDPVAIISAIHDELGDNSFSLLTSEPQAPEERGWLDTLQKKGFEISCYTSQTLFSEAQIAPLYDNFPSPFTQFRKIVEADQDIWSIAGPVDAPALHIHEHPLRLQSPVSWPHVGYEVKVPFSGGERGAQAWWHDYLDRNAISHYKSSRNNLMGRYSSSHLSTALAWGCLSVRRVWHDILQYENTHGPSDHTYWLRFELLWREYFHWSLRRHGQSLFRLQGLSDGPRLVTHNEDYWQRWTDAATGVPMVDAGLRELRHSGFVSNRLRQNMASYFIHELNLDWRLGARWFEMHLADFDVASNYGNWAYIAGVGHDPRPQRRFNLNQQLRHYDPGCEHIHFWCPELADIAPDRLIKHQSGNDTLPMFPAPVVPVSDAPE